MAESGRASPIDRDNPALYVESPPGDPPIEWSEHERFVALIEAAIAATVVLIGAVLVTSCGSLTAAPGTTALVCTYPFVFDGTVAIYLSMLVVCAALARPTQPAHCTARNVLEGRYAAMALFFASTLVFVWAIFAGA